MADRKRGRIAFASIALPLTLVLLLVVIGTTAAVGWISYRAAIHSVEDEGFASLKASTAARDNAVAAAIARRREHLQSTLQSVELGCGITGVMVRPCARDMLLPLVRAEQAFGAALYYGGRQPLRVGSFIGSGQASASGLPIFQLRPNNKTAFVTLMHSDTENGYTLSVEFSVSGLLGTTELLRSSTRVLSKTDDRVFVLRESGATPEPGLLTSNELKGCLAGSESSAVDQQRYMWFRPSHAAADTCIEGVRNQQEILAPLSTLKARITRFGVVAGLFAIVLAYVLAWLMARPIIRLRQRVRGFRQGDYDSPVPIVGMGEVRELAYAFASMRDSVKTYRETIAENERRLAMVYKAARLWIWEYDLVTGEMAWQVPSQVSPRKAAIRLRVFLRRVHPEDRAVVCDAIRKAKVTGTYEAEYRIRRHPDEPLIWMSSWGQVMGVLRRRMTGVSLDITARKNSENVIHEKVRLEASAEIAGSLAHEINNPLTAIMAATFMLAQQQLADPAASRYVEIADQQTRRVAQLVNQILGLYHRPTTRVGIEIRTLLEEMVTNFKCELDAKKQHVLLRSDRAVVHGDREELMQALSNIFQNAIESSGSGAEIHIRSHLTHSWADDRRFGLRILVADHGPGIPRGDLAKVFEPFTGTKSERGTGLGLWVARSTIMKHNGTIRVWSSRGKRVGTVVAVFLPIRSRTKTVRAATTPTGRSERASAGLAG